MITIHRASLLPALADAVKAADKRGTIPILQNVLVYAADDRLTLAATDLDVEIRASAPCAGSIAPFTAPAALLHDAVRKLPESATVTIEADASNATVVSGRSRFRLPVLPASDFPELSPGDMPSNFRLAPADLAKMIATVRFAVSSEEARYYLNGIHWHVDTAIGGGDLIAVATDGHRLSRLSWPLPDGADGMRSIILPRRAIDLLKPLTEGKEPVEVSTSEWKARFVAGDVTLTTKLIDGTFPDYQRVIPAADANPMAFTLAKAALHAAVDRVVTISAGKGSAVKFAFGAEAVRLTAQNPDTGTAEDEVTLAAPAAGESIEVGFSGRYLLDMLAACPSETLTFRLADAAAPARIEPEGAPDLTFVLMPMRVA